MSAVIYIAVPDKDGDYSVEWFNKAGVKRRQCGFGSKAAAQAWIAHQKADAEAAGHWETEAFGKERE